MHGECVTRAAQTGSNVADVFSLIRTQAEPASSGRQTGSKQSQPSGDTRPHLAPIREFDGLMSDIGRPSCFGQATRRYRRYFGAWYLFSAPPRRREFQHVSSGFEHPEGRIQARPLKNPLRTSTMSLLVPSTVTEAPSPRTGSFSAVSPPLPADPLDDASQQRVCESSQR
jgi:hypothetical protein